MKQRLLSLILLLFLLLSACAAKPRSAPADHVISHRGASGEEPEHSFAAYDLAVAYGSRYIEQDLVLSADGTLYVSHDLSPVQFNGDETPFRELHDDAIDAIRTQDGRGVLRMSEVLARYGDSVCYVTELKLGMEQLEPFLALVQESGLDRQFLVQAWDLKVLEAIEERYPEMPKVFLNMYRKPMQEALGVPCVDIVAVPSELMTESNCVMVHAAEKKFCTWTLNSTEAIKKAIELGMDCYFTNYTAKALLLEAEYRKDPDE